MRITPFRLMTLQCSQIGFTLLRTFTRAPSDRYKWILIQAFNCTELSGFFQVGRGPELPQSGALESRQADLVAHRRFFLEKVGEMNTLEHVVDLALQQHPDRPNAAALRCRAALFLDRVCYAMQIEGRQLRRGDHVTNGDLVGRACKHVAAVRATDTLHDVGATKAQENLLDVVGRQPLLGRQVASRNRSLGGPTGQVDRTDESIFRPRRNAHDTQLRPFPYPAQERSIGGSYIAT
jgi:hypothetical protein